MSKRLSIYSLNNSTNVPYALYAQFKIEREAMAMAEPTAAAMPTVHTATTMESSLLVDGGERRDINEQPRWFTPTRWQTSLFPFPFLGLPFSFFRWLCYSLISSCHQVVQVFFFSLMLLIQFITLSLLVLLCSSSRFQYWGSRLCLGRMLLCQFMERNYITLVL